MIPTASIHFSGAGLLSLGFMNAGVDVVSSYELDSNACKTHRRNFKHKVNECDLREVRVLDTEETDIIVGTYPCKKYSTMANISGTRFGEDLYLHFFRQLAIRKPEAYLLENVPGMKYFPVVMEAMTKLPDYYVNVFCPVNASNWLPQNRERLIIIGTKRNFLFHPPQPTHRVKLKNIIEECPDFELSECVKNRLNGVYRDRPIITDPSDPAAMAPTCLAHSADNGYELVLSENGNYIVPPFFPDTLYLANLRYIINENQTNNTMKKATVIFSTLFLFLFGCTDSRLKVESAQVLGTWKESKTQSSYALYIKDNQSIMRSILKDNTLVDDTVVITGTKITYINLGVYNGEYFMLEADGSLGFYNRENKQFAIGEKM